MANKAHTPSLSSADSSTSEGSDVCSRAAAARLVVWSEDQGWMYHTSNHVFGKLAVHNPQGEVLQVHEEKKRYRGRSA